MAGGLAVLGTITVDGAYAHYALGIVLTALGCGIATPLLSEAIMNALPPERAGVGSGLQSLAREFGSALGIAVAGSLITATFTARLPASLGGGGDPPSTPAAALAAPGGEGAEPAIVQAFTDAIGHTMPVLAGLVTAAAVTLVRWFPRES
ncbi:hypothetical protein AN216_05315 [Streptomyces oceani]|uniref:Major facilitator superfamily (MFS) profile domain-containing protein n=2 Tax=Streptomyces oceani TaxID=1075402 RepID=A0A1E7KLT5_9ACTN|nr:hypothetical protein AN216_05315 [Streptomyces oceani]